MNEEQYLSRIRQLENEIEYLHGLLNSAGIPYRYAALDVEDPQLERSINYDSDQGGRIIPIPSITPKHIQYFYHLFKGRSDVYSKRSGKPNKKTGKHGYYTQCWNFWKDEVCPKKYNAQATCTECHNQKYKELNLQVLRPFAIYSG